MNRDWFDSQYHFQFECILHRFARNKMQLGQKFMGFIRESKKKKICNRIFNIPEIGSTIEMLATNLTLQRINKTMLNSYDWSRDLNACIKEHDIDINFAHCSIDIYIYIQYIEANFTSCSCSWQPEIILNLLEIFIYWIQLETCARRLLCSNALYRCLNESNNYANTFAY